MNLFGRLKILFRRLAKGLSWNNPVSVGVFIILFVICCSSAKRLYSAEDGGQPCQFLTWGAGARSLAMGKAYVGISDDASAVYWNPAGLVQSDRREISMLHASLWESTQYDFIGYVHPMLYRGVLGGSIVRLATPEIDKRDENNVSLGEIKDSQLGVILSYGQNIRENLSVGASMKYTKHELDHHNSGYTMMDVSCMYYGINRMRIGLNIQNIISLALGSDRDSQVKVPVGVKAGGSYRFINDKLLLSMEMEKSQKTDLRLHLGGEYKVIDLLRLRIGVNGREEICAGFGIEYNDFAVDYAYGLHDLGGSHRFSMGYKFGPSAEMMRKVKQAEAKAMGRQMGEGPMSVEYYEKGQELYRSGLYEAALERMTQALVFGLESGQFAAERGLLEKQIDRLKKVSMHMGEVSGEGKVNELVRKGVEYYLSGDDEKAVNTLGYAYTLQLDNKPLENLLKEVELETGIRLEMLGMSLGWSLVEQKLHKALVQFREGKFDEAIKLCEEVISLEPENAMAYKRLGSAFYALGQKSKAIKAWGKAMELDPEDTKLKALLKSLE